jgi:hypothetical protein
MGHVVRDKEMVADGQHLFVCQKADHRAVIEAFRRGTETQGKNAHVPQLL